MSNSPADVLKSGQVTVTTAAARAVPGRSGRVSVTIINEGTTDVRLGGPDVTGANGALLAGVKGQTLVLHTAAEIYAIVGAGTQAISYVENC